MKYRFPYKLEESSLLNKVYRPVIDFEVKTSNGWIPVLAYMDSGADVTLLPKSFIDLLDIRLDDHKISEISGVGGEKVPVILVKIGVRICKVFMQINAAIALIEEVPYILGRDGVFDKFKVTFRQKIRAFYLESE